MSYGEKFEEALLYAARLHRDQSDEALLRISPRHLQLVRIPRVVGVDETGLDVDAELVPV